MIRWWLIGLLCCLLPPAMAVEITDLPQVGDEQYDITWHLAVGGHPSSAMQVDFTAASGKSAYQLRLGTAGASWRQVGTANPLPASNVVATLEANSEHDVTLKRRPDTVALLVDHRLVLCAPAPSIGKEKIALHPMPAGLTISDARYHKVEPRIFGDDFMRPEAPKPDGHSWLEDPTWQVAYYRKDNPGKDPRDAKSGQSFTNPWSLSLFAVIGTSTNGFWFLYTGNGPSWVVSNPNMVGPEWDRYFAEASVRPEYDSTIGLIAAYQDNQNYLLFRWHARDYTIKGKEIRAQLIAMVQGKERVLAESPQGFDPEQWYKLRMNLSWQRVEALVDGKVLLASNNPGPVEGRVGLYADGAAHPRKPKLDDATASMYVATDTKTGKTVNDAADAIRVSSCIYFDDVHIGDWVGIDNLPSSPYVREKSGTWDLNGSVLESSAAGRIVTGSNSWSQYEVNTRVKIPGAGSGGLFIHLDGGQNGYLWNFSTKEQRLIPVTNGTAGAPVDHNTAGLQPYVWTNLQVEADGPYIACYCNGQRVLETYDPKHTAGRCGIYAGSSGVQFDTLSLAPLVSTLKKVKIHKGFGDDAWMATWSGAEADWYPAVNHGVMVRLSTVSGRPGDPGPAGPLATNIPGVYWQKGGFYNDLRVTVPVSAQTLNGQALFLSTNYNEKTGYRLLMTQADGKGQVTLQRADQSIGTYAFPLGKHTQLVFERKGTLLLLSAREIDAEDTSDEPAVLSEKMLFTYRDEHPLKAEMLGFNVTNQSLPAATLVVESDRVQDAFEQSPVLWTTQSGIWAVMARYSCQPQWNWFGGFGSGTPTVWSKMRLDGDQNVEVYMGVKMKYDNMTEGEYQRFRDMNVTICADGAHLNTGYSLIRSGRQGNQPITMLLRKGVVVKSSTLQADLVPGGHRQWFSVRLEKRGGEIKVFLDNHLAMTYIDQDPLPGGYAALWTLNNGIMIGRANLSAEKMTTGTPQAAVPLVVQEELPPLTSPKITVNGKACEVAGFETDFDGWQSRPGLSGALVRERVTNAAGKPNTYLKIVNTYPAGDLSATVSTKPVDLAATPIFSSEYCFDKGAQVNLYLRYRDTWYEFLMTGHEADDSVKAAGRIAVTADGAGHHMEADLGKMLAEAIQKQTGAAPADLTVQEVVVADWSAPAYLRHYGFCANPGGTAIRFDNTGFLPRAQ